MLTSGTRQAIGRARMDEPFQPFGPPQRVGREYEIEQGLRSQFVAPMHDR